MGFGTEPLVWFCVGYDDGAVQAVKGLFFDDRFFERLSVVDVGPYGEMPENTRAFADSSNLLRGPEFVEADVCFVKVYVS